MTPTTPSAPDEVVLDEDGLRKAANAIAADTPIGQMHRASEIAGKAIRAYLRASPQPAGVTEEQVEAAARALAKRAVGRVATTDGAERMIDKGWIVYADDARAALEAARLPSPTDTRERVLEEAAQFAEDYPRRIVNRGDGAADVFMATPTEIAAGIRALKSKPEAPVEDGWSYDMSAAPPEHHKICVVWKDAYSEGDEDGPRYTLGYTYRTGTGWAHRPSSHWVPVAWAEFPHFDPAALAASTKEDSL